MHGRRVRAPGIRIGDDALEWPVAGLPVAAAREETLCGESTRVSCTGYVVSESRS